MQLVKRPYFDHDISVLFRKYLISTVVDSEFTVNGMFPKQNEFARYDHRVHGPLYNNNPLIQYESS
jgi:hypothetical protein